MQYQDSEHAERSSERHGHAIERRNDDAERKVLAPRKEPRREEGKHCHGLKGHKYEGADARKDRAEPGRWRIVGLCDLRTRDEEGAHTYEGETYQPCKRLDARPNIVKNSDEMEMRAILIG